MSALVLTFLVNAAWQVPLVAAIVAALETLLRGAPARERHLLWRVTLFASLAIPTLAALNALQLEAPPFLIVERGNDAAPASTSRAAFEWPNGTGLLLLTACVAAFVYRAVALGWAIARTTRMRREARPAVLPQEAATALALCERALRIRNVPVLASRLAPGPVTLGALRPVVLLPHHLVEGDYAPVWTSVLGHELAHIHRRDFAWNLAYEVLLLPLAFHPAAAWIRRHLRATREQSCDELVAEKLVDPARYARSLLQVAGKTLARTGAFYSLALLDPNRLEERIMRLLEKPRPPRRLVVHAAWAALVVTTFALSLLSVRVEASSVEPIVAPLVSLLRAPVFQQSEPPEPTYDAAGRRDPFVSATPPIVTESGLPGIALDAVKLRGIVYSSSGYRAMIVAPDNKTYFVSPGQRFYDGMLLSIDRKGLTFRKEIRSVVPTPSVQEIRLELEK